jgi:hypothetical protein
MIIAKEELEVNKMELRAKASKIKGHPGVIRIHESHIEEVDFDKGDEIELCTPGTEGTGIIVEVSADRYIQKGFVSIRKGDMDKLNIRNNDLVILRRYKAKGDKSGKRQSKEVVIEGNKLSCPICANDQFWSRTTLLNTRGLTFLDWDWVNKNAQNYVCSKCGYIYWFHL